jgi:hypothetical protein
VVISFIGLSPRRPGGAGAETALSVAPDHDKNAMATATQPVRKNAAASANAAAFKQGWAQIIADGTDR